LEVRREQLHAHRQAIDEAGGHGQARQAREVGGDGVEVFQVLGNRVAGLGADLPGRVRRGWAEDHVDFFKGSHEVVLDQATDFLRLEVVRVVVAGRQGVGTDHNAALNFGAETFATGAFVQVGQVLRVFAAVAEAHAVETRQVGRSFRRRDHVVRRNGVLVVRQADFLDHGAQAFQRLDAVVHQFGDTRVETGAEVFLRHADAQAFERGIQAAAVVRDWLIDACGVLRIKASHAL